MHSYATLISWIFQNKQINWDGQRGYNLWRRTADMVLWTPCNTFAKYMMNPVLGDPATHNFHDESQPSKCVFNSPDSHIPFLPVKVFITGKKESFSNLSHWFSKMNDCDMRCTVQHGWCTARPRIHESTVVQCYVGFKVVQLCIHTYRKIIPKVETILL